MPPVVAQTLVGTWNEDYVETQNFEKMMKALDPGFINRKVEEKSNHTEEFMVNGDEITLKISNALKSETMHFKLGQELCEKTLDGREMKTTFTEEDGRLVQTSFGAPYNSVQSRQLEGEFMVLTMVVHAAPEPIKCIRKYRRQATQ